ncbi:MAG: DUF262 domain-containing protein [Calditrichaeota bacterium]|nr:DUF262 domain-containing protein [Calditrichota bacterium]
MESVKIFDLLEKVDKGEVVIPDFQRPFVWKNKQVEELLNSIAKGYFIGSILMLEDYPNNRFAPKPILGVKNYSHNEGKTIKYILDGQQRVSSLYYAFYEPDVPMSGQVVRFYYSHKDDEVIAAQDPNALARRLGVKVAIVREFIQITTGVDVHSLPTMAIFRNDDAFYAFLDSHKSLTDKFQRQLRTVFERIQDYKLPIITLPIETPDDDIVNVFERINRTGTELGTFDLAVARYYPIGVKLNELMKPIETQQFVKHAGKVSILKVMAILKGRDPKPKALLGLSEPEENNVRRKLDFENSWNHAVELLIHSFQRMESHYGARKVGRKRAFVPYTSLIVPLATIIDDVIKNGGQASAWEKVDSWYWYSVFSQRYTSAVGGKSLYDYKSIGRWIEDDDSPPQYPSLTKAQLMESMSSASSGAALAKAFFSRLIMKQVMDLNTAQMLTDYSNCVVDHIFPKSGNHGTGVNSIFNYTLLEKDTNGTGVKGSLSPAEFIENVCLPSHNYDGDRIARTFKSHFIEDDALGYLQQNNIQGFLKARADCFVDYLFEKHFKSIIRADRNPSETGKSDKDVQDKQDI